MLGSSQEGRLAKTIDDAHEHFISCIRWVPLSSISGGNAESDHETVTGDCYKVGIRCVVATGSADACQLIFGGFIYPGPVVSYLIILYILSSLKCFTFLILLFIWGSRNFHRNEAEKFRRLKPKPKCEKKHNKPNTAKKIIQTGAKLSGRVKAKTALAKEQARANEWANAERKAQAKADKARANERADAERKAQAKADKARAKEQAFGQV